MKHVDKALLGAGLAFVLSGGVAAAALTSGELNFGSAQTAPAAGAQGVDHGPGGRASLSAAAAYIGISETDLRTQLQAGKSLADVAVANGKTRDGLIAALVAAATKDITALVDQKGLPGPVGGGGFGFRSAIGDPLNAAAAYLGTTVDALRTQLQGGQTLAQIAAATSGKSRDGLIQALVSDESAKIDQAQQNGTLTADQATRLKQGITDRVTHLVDSTPPAGPFPGGFRGPRPSGSPRP